MRPHLRRGTLAVALAAAALAGAVTAVAVRGGQAAPAAPAPPQLATATVVRTNLVTTALTGGTLGYAPARPVVNQVTGIYTWLPRTATAVTAPARAAPASETASAPRPRPRLTGRSRRP